MVYNCWEQKAFRYIKIETIPKGQWKSTTSTHFNNFQKGGPKGKPCKPPLKQVYGIFDKKFLFSETQAIPLVTEWSSNFATLVARELFDIPNEEAFYEKNANCDDIDELRHKAIPVVAEILYYEAQFKYYGFEDEVNFAYLSKQITKEEVLDIARQITPYKECMGISSQNDTESA